MTDNEVVFSKFFQIYQEATKNVSIQYSEIMRFGSSEIKLKERVYCYELYHQIRSIWKEHSEYLLQGEVDKRDHMYMYGIPDFILHIPRKMEFNVAVIEVKHSDNTNFICDIFKLQDYMLTGSYTYSIAHVFGYLEKPQIQEAKKHLELNQFFIYHNIQRNEISIVTK